ncbi:putative O-sialoglycoprotein endopeptidase [Grosmannia clavigera kw1407]|uniref:N(6)-L-threonylcarbamoyladenine synthase n=1 Tax=Grosmannia clavigera (strain kw1407 / UAMH 11150) TaxID=655863 RepID=F0XII3_GROCL|nr:putative O-sialoglycoprotein endopeptidase [Grosmannia clavigera kw1407]EFX02557.1 putative O-sialoglycoprotein endopeptidase [Grosmannia clavigera kw1407]
MAQGAEARERWPDSLVTLAIETSCDDTCVAVLEKEREQKTGEEKTRRRRARLLFEERITADNRAFGGIHPLTATESHMAALGPLIQQAKAHLPANRSGQQRPDFVSVTRGPGMASSLATGLSVAKGLAVAWDVPLMGVHHMQAHALTPRLVSAIDDKEAPFASFPYLSLLVSGGHTLLLHSRGLADHRILAAAANIAIGDLLDKSARAILPRGYIAAAETAAGRSLPYGELLEGFAGQSESKSESETAQTRYSYPATRRDEMAPFESGRGWRLEAPLANGILRRALRFDFSGLNGAVIRLAKGDGRGGEDEPPKEPSGAGIPDEDRPVLARGTMQLAFEHLASRLVLALESGAVEGVAATANRRRAKVEAEAEAAAKTDQGDPPSPPSCLVVAGGVASNRFLRQILRSALDVRGFGYLPLVAPPPALCTDNAAMIAWAGMELFEAGWRTDLRVLPRRRWAMDSTADDGGILGMDGWLRED